MNKNKNENENENEETGGQTQGHAQQKGGGGQQSHQNARAGEKDKAVSPGSHKGTAPGAGGEAR